MYVSDKDIDTISELSAFVDGALESADDSEYWGDLSKRVDLLQKKMIKSNAASWRKRIKNSKRCKRLIPNKKNPFNLLNHLNHVKSLLRLVGVKQDQTTRIVML